MWNIAIALLLLAVSLSADDIAPTRVQVTFQVHRLLFRLETHLYNINQHI